MHQPHRPGCQTVEQIAHSLDVDPPGQLGVELAGPQRAIAGAIEDTAKLVSIEKPRQVDRIFSIAGYDAFARKPPIVLLPDADYLAGVAPLGFFELSVVGSDYLSQFAVIVDQPGDFVGLVGRGHRYRLEEAT